MGGLAAAGLPAIAAQAPAVMDETADKLKKEGIAKMLSGIGKGHDKTPPSLDMPQQQGFDLQGLLASLFGGG
jgi:hypothetical protein